MNSVKIFLFSILFLITGGLFAQWNNICQFDSNLNDIWFVDENTGYVCGTTSAAKLMKTTDGGYTWEDITPAEFTGPIYVMTFIEPTRGFLSWRDNNWSRTYLDRSLDTGISWTVQYWTVPYINTICFPTPQVGYTFPSAMEYIDVVKTIDGGETWQRIQFYTAPMPVGGVKDCSFPDESTGYLVTGYGSIYKTTDGGFTLSRVYNDDNYYLSGITFLSIDTGFATGYLKDCMSMENCGVLLKTTDGGVNWEEQIFNNDCYDVCFPTRDTGFLATSAYPSSYGIYKTTDKGNTWLPDTCNYYSSVSKIHFTGTNIGYALASAASGTALMKRDPDIGVTLPEKIQPGLFQVYPIPARERITVSFFLSQQQSVAIDLLDQFGRIVKRLCDKNFPSGNYSLNYDISTIPAGFYFCRIRMDSDVMIKKLIFEK